METRSSKDIVVVGPNLFGHDKIIGDVHGSNVCLQMVLASLQPEDRLFIVGDLTDRGKKSQGVVTTIRHFQRKHPGRLHVAKGNHEELCLQTVASLEKLSKELLTELPYTPLKISFFIDEIKNLKSNVLLSHYGRDIVPVRYHVNNGGAWLVRLFLKEMNNRLITFNDEGEAQYHEKSYIKQICLFMENLPYIIRVEGERPFNIVHADMPIDDVKLLKKIRAKQFSLTHDEKKYAIWAREVGVGISNRCDIRETGRGRDSSITYVGHSIIAYGTSSVVRSSTNTVNLDIATFQYDICLIANHDRGHCEFIGTGIKRIRDNPFLICAYDKVLLHLQADLKKCRESDIENRIRIMNLKISHIYRNEEQFRDNLAHLVQTYDKFKDDANLSNGERKLLARFFQPYNDIHLSPQLGLPSKNLAHAIQDAAKYFTNIEFQHFTDVIVHFESFLMYFENLIALRRDWSMQFIAALTGWCTLPSLIPQLFSDAIMHIRQRPRHYISLLQDMMIMVGKLEHARLQDLVANSSNAMLEIIASMDHAKREKDNRENKALKYLIEEELIPSLYQLWQQLFNSQRKSIVIDAIVSLRSIGFEIKASSSRMEFEKNIDSKLGEIAEIMLPLHLNQKKHRHFGTFFNSDYDNAILKMDKKIMQSDFTVSKTYPNKQAYQQALKQAQLVRRGDDANLNTKVLSY